MGRTTIAILLTLLLAGCSGYRGLTFKIPGNSMSPTINEGDIVHADTVVYKVSPVERGDIVVLKDPDGKKGPDGQVELYVKRVVGMGGEKLQVISGRLYVADRPVGGIFASGKYASDYPVQDFGPVVVPQGEYFVVGDNLANSYDSRHWKRSTLRMEDIYGKVTLVKDKNSGEMRSL
jgi:signal peptidase I